VIISIFKKKRFSGATPPIIWLEEYHHCSGMTSGIRALCILRNYHDTGGSVESDLQKEPIPLLLRDKWYQRVETRN